MRSRTKEGRSFPASRCVMRLLPLLLLAAIVSCACGDEGVPEAPRKERRKVVVKAVVPGADVRSGDRAEPGADVQAVPEPLRFRLGGESPISGEQAAAESLEPLDPVEPLAAGPEDAVLLPDFAAVYERVTPSVVKITTFGSKQEIPAQKVESGLGTGFFYGAPGDILTNAHVVADGTRFVVETSDGRSVEAVLLGLDPLTDLALLHVDLEQTPRPLSLAPQESLRVGMWVLAVGNPLGLEFSASRGIISALNRTEALWDSVGYWDFIQFDAPINQGNSGGPLLDRYGRVVGVCTAIVAEANRIGYAIPLTTAEVVAEHLRDFGKLKRAWLGIEIVEEDGRIKVTGVYPDSPARKAGLKPGDIIVELDDEAALSVESLRWRIAIHDLLEPARFEIDRSGVRLPLEVDLVPALETLPGR